MTAPTSALAAASNAVLAMSNVWARRLIAGTVKPATSPRARAVYRSWMLALSAPSAWLASQTIHWAAEVVASSVENAAVQARSRIAVDRNAASSSTTRTSPSRCAAARMVERRSAVEVATWGIGGTSPWWAFAIMVRRDRRAVPPALPAVTSERADPTGFSARSSVHDAWATSWTHGDAIRP